MRKKMSLNEPIIDIWEITMPDGMLIRDEIEYTYGLSVTGISLVPRRNRRIVTEEDGTEQYMPVPENFVENRAELSAILDKWQEIEGKNQENVSNREKNYVRYSAWMREHLPDGLLTTLLCAGATKT
jgi:hypothetical protein